MPSTVLHRELYSVAEAADLLGVAVTTLRWWLEGGKRQGRLYEPVIRESATGSTTVTWGEFVEAGYLREYRRVHHVPLQQVRAFIDALRNAHQIPYPLAHFKPFVGEGQHLMLQLQQDLELPVELWAVVSVPGGQALLTAPAESFLSRVDFSPEGDQWAERLFPAGRKSLVVIDPQRSSGIPTIKGIRTEALAELVDAGEPAEAVADMFGVPVNLVKAAVSFEWQKTTQEWQESA